MAQLWALRSFGETVICSTLAQSVCLRDQTQQICCCPVQSLSCWQHMDLSTGSQDQPASNLIPTLLESFWRNTHHIELRVHVLRKKMYHECIRKWCTMPLKKEKTLFHSWRGFCANHGDWVYKSKNSLPFAGLARVLSQFSDVTVPILKPMKCMNVVGRKRANLWTKNYYGH